MDDRVFTGTWTKLTLIALGAVGGAVAFLSVAPSVIGGGSKVAAVFLGTVWVTIMAFALKVADVTEAPGISPEQHERLEIMVRCAVKRVWLYAGANAVAALFILIPSIIVDAKEPLKGWMCVAGGASIGFCVYSIIAQAWWQEELRRFRSRLREDERVAEIAEKLTAKLPPNLAEPLTEEEKDRIAKLHLKMDWPASST